MEMFFGVILSGSITLLAPEGLSCTFSAGPPPGGIADPLRPGACTCEFRNAWRRYKVSRRGMGVETSDDFKVTEPGAIFMYTFHAYPKLDALEECSPPVG